MAITEGSIIINIPDGCIVTKFDDASHGLSHCMKAVDFIVETPGALLLIELKDPDAAPPERKQHWVTRLSAGSIDNDLKVKFRDTWLYLYGIGRLNKPVNYLVLIGLSALSAEALAVRTASLKKQLPLEGPTGPWVNQLAAGCAVHNLASWNRSFGDFLARRA